MIPDHHRAKARRIERSLAKLTDADWEIRIEAAMLAATTMATDLVMTPLRMALWQRDREGHPVEPKSLISHSDAGSQYTSVAFTERLALAPLIHGVWEIRFSTDVAS